MKANPIHMLLVLGAVLVVGVVMAATGFSRDTFMGLALIGAAVGLVVPSIKNVQSPPPGTSKASYVFMIVMAALLAAGGLFVLIYGIPE